MNNKENIWNFKAQNISETQFIDNEIVQNEIMRLVLHAGRDLGSACWEIVMGTSIGWSGSCSFQLKTCLVTPWHSVVSPQRAPEHCSLWKVRQQVLEDILDKYICKTSYIIIKSINNFQWNSPMTVMDGLSFPSGLNVSFTSTFANGLFGLGSFGVPSTRVHIPMVTFQPITLYNTQQWSYNNQNNTNWSSLFHFKIPEWR